jgi:signal transduction histidine kinase/DNA-binding CsgD family transcriptional regulator
LEQSLNMLLSQVKAHQNAAHQNAAHQTSHNVSAAYTQQALQTLATMIARTLTDFRELTADLNPGDLHDLGIVPALESLALRIEQRYGLTITPDMSAISSSLPSHLPLAIYRIAQEALHNIGQHAGAARVGLSLHKVREGLRLIIADDGGGFYPPEPLDALIVVGKNGLGEISAWAAATGGQLEINSVIGVGTQVRVLLPLELPKLAATPQRTIEDSESFVESLTSRECDVLGAVTGGLTNKQIAVQLGISDRTVQFHLSNVLSKLGVASRTEAAVLALQKGLFQERKGD